jgi:hypothetical protein
MKLTETAVETGLSSKKPAESPINEGTQKTVKSFVDATRIQESVTSGLERKALLWMACRMPSWVSSDQLTLLLLFVSPLASRRTAAGYSVPGGELVWR